MLNVDVQGLTPDQEVESDEAFVEVLGPIPPGPDGSPLFTPREFRDHCMKGYFKLIVSQSRGVMEAKSKTPHSVDVENEYEQPDKP